MNKLICNSITNIIQDREIDYLKIVGDKVESVYIYRIVR